MKITVIPPARCSNVLLPIEQQVLNVAAYCRVSTNNASQLESLNLQVTYFEKLILQNPNWKLSKIYADVGSGLKTQNLKRYQNMIQDSKQQEFDIVLVKSLSRFGRDTVTTLEQIREWKKMNIALCSEQEGINSLQVDESILSILLAVAQEESRMKSENIKFGIRQRMRSGKAIVNHSQFLGYTKGEDCVLIVVPEEAEIVCKIFDLYLQGNGTRKIKKFLEANSIKTATGKSEWSTSTIDRILSNEKYIGQLVMQKTFTPDFITGKHECNVGQERMFIVENTHDAIIEKSVFMEVQTKKQS